MAQVDKPVFTILFVSPLNRNNLFSLHHSNLTFIMAIKTISDLIGGQKHVYEYHLIMSVSLYFFLLMPELKTYYRFPTRPFCFYLTATAINPPPLLFLRFVETMD